MGAVDPLGQDANVVGMQATEDSRPIHRVRVNGFWMDKTEVTNRQFAAFVKATGYVTIAERTPTAEDFPGAPPENLVAGSVVFTPPDHAVPLDSHFRWWSYVDGADWRHPLGPGERPEGPRGFPGRARRLRGRRGLREVGRQAAADRGRMGVRRARRARAGRSIPGATSSCEDGKFMANTHQGHFPNEDTHADAHARHRAGRARTRRTATASTTSPATSGSGPATGTGRTTMRSSRSARRRGAIRGARIRRTTRASRACTKRVHRGGSFLCTEQYCSRYMVGTRGKGEPSTGTNHLGFRLVKDP